MESHGEGNYASTACSNTGDQEKDQGLTLSPKILLIDQCQHTFELSREDQKSKCQVGTGQLGLGEDENHRHSDLLNSNLFINSESLLEPLSKKRKLSVKSIDTSHSGGDSQFSPGLVSPSTAISKSCSTVSNSESYSNAACEAANFALGTSIRRVYSPKTEVPYKKPSKSSLHIDASTDSDLKTYKSSENSYSKDICTILINNREDVHSPCTPAVLPVKQALVSQSNSDALQWNQDIPILSTENFPQSEEKTTQLSKALNKKVPDWSLDQAGAKHPVEREKDQCAERNTDELPKAPLFQKKDFPHDSSIGQNSEQTLISRYPSISLDPCDNLSLSNMSGAQPNRLYKKVTSSLPMACAIEMAGSSRNTILRLIAELTTYEDYRETAPNYQIPSSYRQILDELNAQWSQGTKKNEFRKALIAYVREKIESQISNLQPNENDQIQTNFSETLAHDEEIDAAEKLIHEIGTAAESSKILIRNILAKGREQIAYLQHENSYLKTENARLQADLQKFPAQSQSVDEKDPCNLSALSAYLTQYPSSPHNHSASYTEIEQNLVLSPSIENWDGFDGNFWQVGAGEILSE